MSAPAKVGSVWKHRFMLGGVRVSGTFPTKGHALAWESDQRAKITAPAGSSKTCGDAFTKYSEEVSPHKAGHKWEKLRLAAFGKTDLAQVAIRSVKTADIALWRDQRLLTVKGSTINRELNLMSHVFSVARAEWHWLDASPTADLRRPTNPHSRDRRISQDEIDMICHALGYDGEVKTKSQAVAAAFLFAIETAMRAGEIAQLTQPMIGGSVAHLPAHICKNRHKRAVPLSRTALKILFSLNQPLPTLPTLFGLSAASIDALFRKARATTPIVDLHFHDTRHEAITRLAAKLDVLPLARMVGHRDLKQLLTYYNLSAADMVKDLD